MTVGTLTRGTRVSKRTVQIVKALLREQRRVSSGGELDWGFRTKLAAKFGLARSRVTNIARQFGLTDKRQYRHKEGA